MRRSDFKGLFLVDTIRETMFTIRILRAVFIGANSACNILCSGDRAAVALKNLQFICVISDLNSIIIDNDWTL